MSPHHFDVRVDLGRHRLRVLITDADSRMIVGWRVAGHMRTAMVLDAIEMARWSHGKTLAGLRCHSDAAAIQLNTVWRAARRDRRGALHGHRR